MIDSSCSIEILQQLEASHQPRLEGALRMGVRAEVSSDSGGIESDLRIEIPKRRIKNTSCQGRNRPTTNGQAWSRRERQRSIPARCLCAEYGSHGCSVRRTSPQISALFLVQTQCKSMRSDYDERIYSGIENKGALQWDDIGLANAFLFLFVLHVLLQKVHDVILIFRDRLDLSQCHMIQIPVVRRRVD